MYSWVVKGSLYFFIDKCKNEILRIGKYKDHGSLAGICPPAPPTLAYVGRGRYKGHLLPICCGDSDFPPSNRPARYRPPRTSPTALLDN